MDITWTVAYRLRRANRFLRVGGVALSWDAATELALDVLEALGDRYEVYYVPTAESDALRADDDQGNILVPSGRRVKIKEGGVLPEGVTVTSAVVAEIVPTVEIVLPARFAEFIEGTNLIQNSETDGDPYTDEVMGAWNNARLRNGQTVLTLTADQRGTNVLDWLYEYAYTIGFDAGSYSRGEKSAAMTVRNRVSNAKYAIYKINH